MPKVAPVAEWKCHLDFLHPDLGFFSKQEGGKSSMMLTSLEWYSEIWGLRRLI